jgi:hypothetical protein
MHPSAQCPPLVDTAPPATRYTPDPLVVAGANWARRKGIPNHQFSVIRVTDHAHVINCMFDMNTLAAVVVEGSGGYQTKVLPVSDGSCGLCAKQAAAKARDDRLQAAEDEYEAYEAWATEQGLPSTAGLYWAWAALRDRGVSESGRSGGAPW